MNVNSFIKFRRVMTGVKYIREIFGQWVKKLRITIKYNVS